MKKLELQPGALRAAGVTAISIDPEHVSVILHFDRATPSQVRDVVAMLKVDLELLCVIEADRPEVVIGSGRSLQERLAMGEECSPVAHDG